MKNYQSISIAKRLLLTSCLASVLAWVGCAGDDATPENSVGDGDTSIDGSEYLLTEEPAGAEGVIAVRNAAVDGDDVVIVGRIGGSANPWIDGRAAFSIVDGSLKACSDIEGDHCSQPWDYCCETPQLPEAMALIKVVDKDGQLVKSAAKNLLNVQELSTVVVQGKAQRDDDGNLIVLASGLFIRTK
jgi:hypothetical protein